MYHYIVQGGLDVELSVGVRDLAAATGGPLRDLNIEMS